MYFYKSITKTKETKPKKETSVRKSKQAEPKSDSQSKSQLDVPETGHPHKTSTPDASGKSGSGKSGKKGVIYITLF